MIAGTTFECDRCGHVRSFAGAEGSDHRGRRARAAAALAEQSGWALTDAAVDPERVLCPHCVAYLDGGPAALPADDAPDPVELDPEDLLEELDRSWCAEALLGAERD